MVPGWTRGWRNYQVPTKLHYYQDCVQILRRARTRGPLRFNGEPVTIFPDYTTTVTKARAAFTEVTYRGEDREFTDPDKAMTCVKNNILTECTWDWSSQLNMMPLSTCRYGEHVYIIVPVDIRYKFIAQCLHFLYTITVPLSYWLELCAYRLTHYFMFSLQLLLKYWFAVFA